MRFIVGCMLTAAAALLPTVASANEGTTPPANPTAVRCKSVRQVGTKIPERVCKTNADWKREEEETREAAASRTRNRRCSGGSSC